ncbi:sulfite exporter TauE/SafE family protein [Thermococcus sp.]
MLDYLIEFLIGIGIGIIAGLFGIGGGFLIVPTLTVMGLPMHLAIGTSLTCIAMSSFVSAFTHLREGRVLLKVAALKELFSVPAAISGAYLTIFINEALLRVIFSVLLMYLAYELIKTSKEKCNPEVSSIHYKNVPLVGIFAGFISGLLGISGGVLNVPLFHTMIGVPMRYAIGTSSVAIFFTALAGAYEHYQLGQVSLETALLLAPGLITGAYIGAKLAHKIQPGKLKLGFAGILILIAIKMVV